MILYSPDEVLSVLGGIVQVQALILIVGDTDRQDIELWFGLDTVTSPNNLHCRRFAGAMLVVGDDRNDRIAPRQLHGNDADPRIAAGGKHPFLAFCVAPV